MKLLPDNVFQAEDLFIKIEDDPEYDSDPELLFSAMKSSQSNTQSLRRRFSVSD